MPKKINHPVIPLTRSAAKNNTPDNSNFGVTPTPGKILAIRFLKGGNYEILSYGDRKTVHQSLSEPDHIAEKRKRKQQEHKTKLNGEFWGKIIEACGLAGKHIIEGFKNH